jgi:4-amino-4-deoxy-L-arabinose transferase-like glycosyltransferase
MSSPRRRLWLSALFIGWAFFVLASFFAVQKPFTAINALALGRVMLDLLVAGWLALIGLLLGGWLLQQIFRVATVGALFAGKEWAGLELVVLGSGLGLGLLGLLNFVIGLAGLFRPVMAYGLAIGLSIVLIPQAIRLFRRWRSIQTDNEERRTNDDPHSPVFRLLSTVYLALVLVFTLLVALLPPIDWDGLFYHLTGPKLYLQAGRIVGGVDIPHLNFPSLMEMLFTWAILLRGDIAAKLLHAVFGLLLAGLVYLTAHRFFGRRAALPGLLVLASMPMLSTLAGWAYNDLALAFYQLASLYAIINYQLSITQNSKLTPARRAGASEIQNSPLPWLILSGIFAGLAMGLKYTSFVTPVVIVGLILWNSVRKMSSPSSATLSALRFTLTAVVVFAGTALLVASPWYLKNWLFTGNPVYPFLFDVFGGRLWDSFRAEWYASAGTGIGFKPSTLLALPWLLTLGVRDANYWDGRTGPLFLLFLPIVLLYGLFRYRQSERPAALDPLLIFVLAQFIVWMLGVVWSRSLWQSRLLLPGLAALAPVTGWVWVELARFDLPQFSVSRFINLAIGLTLALTLVDIGLLTLKIDPLPYLTGLESRDQYLTRRLGAYYAVSQQLNEELPPEAVVAFLWEPRSYFCRLECRPDSILDEFPHLVDQYGSAEAIAQAWRDNGVTHVLIHRTGLNFVLGESPDVVNRAVLDELIATGLKLEFEIGDSYQLYAVR